MKILFYPIEKLRENRRSAELFIGLTRSKQRNMRRNRRTQGQFLLDGPARSGNTFATFTIKEMLNIEDFVHHRHSIAALKIAGQERIPVYLLVREPAKVVLSTALYASSRSSEFAWPFNKIDRQSQLMLDYYLYRWTRYYQFALSKENIVFFDANDLFGEPDIIARRIAKDFDLELRLGNRDFSAEYQRTKQAQSIRQGNQVGAGIPNKDKDQAKSRLRHLVERSQYYAESMMLYERLSGYCVRPKLDN